MTGWLTKCGKVLDLACEMLHTRSRLGDNGTLRGLKVNIYVNIDAEIRESVKQSTKCCTTSRDTQESLAATVR